jgi:hypothetical protein
MQEIKLEPKTLSLFKKAAKKGGQSRSPKKSAAARLNLAKARQIRLEKLARRKKGH